MNMFWTIVLCLLQYLIPRSQSVIITELWLKRCDLPTSVQALQVNHAMHSSYRLQITLQPWGTEPQTRELVVNSTFETGQRETFYFADFLSAAQTIPLSFSSSYKQVNTTRLTVIVQDAQLLDRFKPIAEFYKEFHGPTTIAQKQADAKFYQQILVDSESRLTLFVRWYCASGYSGEQCTHQCDQNSCNPYNNAKKITEVYDMVKRPSAQQMPFWVPPLGNTDCPCEPCLVMNVPSKHLLNRRLLQTSIDLLLLVRAIGQKHDTHRDHWTANMPTHVQTGLQIDEVCQSNGSSRVVAICVNAENNRKQPIPPKIIHRALVDLMVTGWLFATVPSSQDQAAARDPSKNDLGQEIENFLERYSQTVLDCQTIRTSRHVMLTGFWIVLSLAVLMSVVTSFLIQKQRNQQEFSAYALSESTEDQKIVKLSRSSVKSIACTEDRSAIVDNMC